MNFPSLASDQRIGSLEAETEDHETRIVDLEDNHHRRLSSIEEVVGEKIGINNTTPNCHIEVGSGTGTSSIRLNGANSLENSSEIIFTDSYAANDSSTDYGNGAGVRWNSNLNRLEFNLNVSGSAIQNAGYLYRTTNAFWNLPRLHVPTQLTLNGVDQTPRSRFLYASKIKRVDTGSTSNPLTIPNYPVVIAWRNSRYIGLYNNESSGSITIPYAGLYRVNVSLACDTTASQSAFKLTMRSVGGSSIVNASDHLSKEESVTSYSLFSLNTFKYFASGYYQFTLECDQDGAGRVLNGALDATTLIIEGMVIPTGTTIPSNYPNA